MQSGEFPPSFYESESSFSQTTPVPTKEINQPDVSQLKQEDLIEDQQKDIPWRFGKAIDVAYNLQNDGAWTDLANGFSIWKLNIEAKGALSLNLNFSSFYLSEEAKLFVYNDSYNDVLGALTSANNKADSLFAIRPIKGERMHLELVVPTEDKGQNKVAINQVVYGYRNIFEKAAKSFGSSGNCNQNVLCTDGDRWQDIKRSVVLILRANNTRWCSGALLNNVVQDGKPFVLTADHCGLQTNSIFVFNYESPNCSPNQDGVLTNSLSGATLRASNFNSDFTLFELTNAPPSSYNVYYAGWSAENVASQKSAAIHHPGGDVKKLSFDEDSVKESGYYGPGTDHWEVSNWEIGTTEQGSSGSPLFDQNQRIVGQLHGGDAACGNSLQDYYGKFSNSWNVYPGSSNQLQPWLDPNNTGTLVLDGYDPAPSLHQVDLELVHFYGLPTYTCDSSNKAFFTIKNRGNQNITSAQFEIELNGQLQNPILWSGNLARNQVVSISLPTLPYVQGINTIKLYIDSLSAGVDQFNTNDTLVKSSFINKNSIQLNLSLKTDDYGSETSWEIKPNNGGNLLSFKSPAYNDVAGGQVYNHPICLYDSCFSLTLRDSWGDGFNGSFGNGFLLLTDQNGDTIVFENNFTGSQKIFNFCLNQLTAIKESNAEKNSLSIYPNPLDQNGSLQINLSKNSTGWKEILIYDLNGREIMVEPFTTSLSLPTKVKSGVYFLQLRNNSEVSETKKLIVK